MVSGQRKLGSGSIYGLIITSYGIGREQLPAGHRRAVVGSSWVSERDMELDAEAIVDEGQS